MTGLDSTSALDLLDALVRIDSVNPGLDPAGAGEAQIAASIARWGRSAGLRVDVLEGTTGRPSVILRGGRDHGGRRLLLCGHLDTVGLPGAPGGLAGTGLAGAPDGLAGTGLAGTGDGLTPRVEGDRLYARGAYDMKAGLAAALIACRDASLAGIDGEVIVAAVADEELASLGIQEVLTQLAPASIDAAVVTEPDRCVFTVERRTLPGETLEHVEADIADLIERCRPADPRLVVSARTLLHRPPMETPASALIVQALIAAAGPGTGAVPMSYWADSAFLAAAGIPTALYGPEGEGAHADTEWVSRSGTSTATTVLTQLARDLCS